MIKLTLPTLLVAISPFFSMTLLAAPPTAAEAPFSTNDLSILFPIDESHGGLPKFIVNAADEKWRVLSLANFNAVLAGADKEQVLLNPKLRDPKNWFLVGMRYAPCTLFQGATPACKEQLRFVFQSLNSERSVDGGFDDYSMHVVFNFNDLKSPQKSDLLESFRGIKNKFSNLTLNRPLGVSPALGSAQGPAYFQALQTEIIEKYVNVRAPSLITFVGLGFAPGSTTETNSDHWVFFSGNIDGTGVWAPATLNVGAPLLSEHLELTEDEMSLKTNIKTTKDQLNLFADPTGKNDHEIALKILDQHQTNDHNVNCASCHHADAHIFPVLFDSDQPKEKAQFLKDTMAMLKNKARVSELLIENSIHIGKMGFEVPAVRVFGYLDTRPLLSQRVVLDSALAVEQANDLAGLKPAPQCADDKKRSALITCVYLNGATASFADCVKATCK